MSQVFISYRLTDDEQKERVRAFGERLRDRGIDVVLDQFCLDEKADGPNWPKWCSDHASKAENIVIVGTQAWFQCCEKQS